MRLHGFALPLALLAACGGSVIPIGPRGPCDQPAATDDACVVEGDSPFWGPGPNTYCPEPDGTEWHLYQWRSSHYERELGTHHSAGRMICEVAPDGHEIEGGH